MKAPLLALVFVLLACPGFGAQAVSEPIFDGVRELTFRASSASEAEGTARYEWTVDDPERHSRLTAEIDGYVARLDLPTIRGPADSFIVWKVMTAGGGWSGR